MIKHKRIVAMLACIAIAFALLFSIFFIVAESNHECIGECCPICYGIRICEQTLKYVGAAIFASTVAASLMLFLVTLGTYVFDNRNYSTLVTLKVKLTD